MFFCARSTAALFIVATVTVAHLDLADGIEIEVRRSSHHLHELRHLPAFVPELIAQYSLLLVRVTTVALKRFAREKAQRV